MPDETPSRKWRRRARTWAQIAGFAGMLAFMFIVLAIWELADSLKTRPDGANPLPPGPEHNALGIAVVISLGTCVVSTVSAASAMFLAWRADRRAERDQAFKFRQSDPKS